MSSDLWKNSLIKSAAISLHFSTLSESLLKSGFYIMGSSS